MGIKCSKEPKTRKNDTITFGEKVTKAWVIDGEGHYEITAENPEDQATNAMLEVLKKDYPDDIFLLLDGKTVVIASASKKVNASTIENTLELAKSALDEVKPADGAENGVAKLSGQKDLGIGLIVRPANPLTKDKKRDVLDKIKKELSSGSKTDKSDKDTNRHRLRERPKDMSEAEWRGYNLVGDWEKNRRS